MIFCKVVDFINDLLQEWTIAALPSQYIYMSPMTTTLSLINCPHGPNVQVANACLQLVVSIQRLNEYETVGRLVSNIGRCPQCRIV